MTDEQIKEKFKDLVDEIECVASKFSYDKSNNTMFWSASRGGSYDLEESTHWQPIVLPKQEEL